MRNLPNPEFKILLSCPSSPSRYSRLFAPNERAVNTEQLKKLGKSMMRAETVDNTPIPRGFRWETCFAGYTYFGQFIDHDLTWDQTPPARAGELSPCETINHRTPWLDLDNLYGDGPESSSHFHLYETDRASFRLGGYPLANGEQFDIPLDGEGNPQLADSRDNNNLIIRQLHAMFLKLHNVAVRELPTKLPAEERFKRARDRVRWQYQWLVRNDFLKVVCKPSIHREILAGRYLIDWEDGFSIPVEFAQGAFRFGHSMVRARYLLNPAIPADPRILARLPEEPPEEIKLETVFTEARNRRPLSVRRAISWRRFLNDAADPERSNGIDTGIVDALLAPDEPREVPVRTLLRGAATKLPTGEQVCEALRVPIPTPSKEELAAYSKAPCKPPWADLEANGFQGQTPLWYYFLLEAQLDQHGAGLGSSGSRIVAEVIEGSLRADKSSFLSCAGSEWMPPPWSAPDREPYAIRDLFGVAVVTGLATRH
jgi:hypothetical protein